MNFPQDRPKNLTLATIRLIVAGGVVGSVLQSITLFLYPLLPAIERNRLDQVAAAALVLCDLNRFRFFPFFTNPVLTPVASVCSAFATALSFSSAMGMLIGASIFFRDESLHHRLKSRLFFRATLTKQAKLKARVLGAGWIIFCIYAIARMMRRNLGFNVNDPFGAALVIWVFPPVFYQLIALALLFAQPFITNKYGE